MRRFIVRTILCSSPFLVLALLYGALCITKDKSGDIGPLGHQFFEKGYHERFDDSTNLDYTKDVPVDSILDTTYTILTIGDSFAKEKSKFQRYVGAVLDECVYNLKYNRHLTPANVALSLLLDVPQERLPEVLILETAERNGHWVLRDMDTKHPMTWDSVCGFQQPKSELQPMNWGKTIVEYYQRRLGMNNKVLCKRLDVDAFSCAGKHSRLYCYMEDTIHSSEEQLKTCVENLEYLHSVAEQKGVRLVYMVAPNKSTVYSNHLVGKHRFFTWTTSTHAFDTIPYYFCPVHRFQELVDEGVQDIYYADDTHWSPIGAKIAGEELGKFILNNIYNNGKKE